MPQKTKELRAAYMRKWRKKNPEKVKERSRVYREKNRETLRERAKGYRMQHPEIKSSPEYRRKHTLKQYNITEDDYNDIFAAQNGKCLICGRHQSEIGKSLHIDHCHKTGKVRGLLCSNCNTAIGLLQDDIENLKCAIMYLNKKD